MTNARYAMIWGLCALYFLFILTIGINMGIHEPMDDTEAFGIGPRTWPRIVTGIIVLASAYLAYLSYKAHRKTKEDNTPDDNVDQMPFEARSLLITFALLAAYYVLVSFLGIALSSAAFFTLFAVRSGEKRHLLVSVIGAILSIGLYFFFYYVAKIPMPPGPFGGVI